MPLKRGHQLCCLVRKLGPANGKVFGAEIGVMRGELSAYLLHVLPRLHLCLVDPWLSYEPEPGYIRPGREKTKRLSDKTMHKRMEDALAAVAFAGNRITVYRQTSVEAAESIADSRLDFAFIDADHSYEGVYADVRAWWPKIKPGGFLAGHDYMTGKEGISFGVTRAVDEWAAALNLPVQRGAKHGDRTVWWCLKEAA